MSFSLLYNIQLTIYNIIVIHLFNTYLFSLPQKAYYWIVIIYPSIFHCIYLFCEIEFFSYFEWLNIRLTLSLIYEKVFG